MREIPENKARQTTFKISKDAFHQLFDELYKNQNVLNVEVRWGPGYTVEVTVHYAIMDIALQLSAQTSKIEELAKKFDPNMRPL